jgi:hypothetical protein
LNNPADHPSLANSVATLPNRTALKKSRFQKQKTPSPDPQTTNNSPLALVAKARSPRIDLLRLTHVTSASKSIVL